MFGGIFHDYLNGPWEAVRGYLREELEQLQAALNYQWSKSFDLDGTLTSSVIDGDSSVNTVYVSNEGPDNKPKWARINLANGVKGRLQYSSLPRAGPNVLMGNGTGTGDYGEIAVGAGLDLTDDELTAEAFPVGSIFQAAVATEPETLLGYGEWELIAVGTATSPGDPITFYYQ